MNGDPYSWARRDGCVGLTHAVRALTSAEQRPPDERDVPPPSTFPMTPAAREAVRIGKEQAPRRRHRVVNRGGTITREPA